MASRIFAVRAPRAAPASIQSLIPHFGGKKNSSGSCDAANRAFIRLRALASSGHEITLTLVPRGTGRRLGIDRDLDGNLDADERDNGTNPASIQLQPVILEPATAIPFGTDGLLEARIPPLPARGTISWWKEGQRIAGATNRVLSLTKVTFASGGHFQLRVETPFQVYTSAVTQITIAPLVVTVSPGTLSIPQG